ncbi:hypothetical protein Holit_02472 [Hollandina sp. SP2]
MKKCVVFLALGIAAFQTATAQENGPARVTGRKPFNEITLDIGPLFVPLFLSDFLDEIYAETKGFGLKAGYDRMVSVHFSAGAEFAFITARAEGESFEAMIKSIDAGIHGRYYPWGKTFYLQAGLGLVSFNFDIDGTTGALEDFKKNFDPYTGISGTLDISVGWRLLIGGHFIVNASILSGIYIGDALSAVTLFKAVSGGIPALTGKGFPLRFDAGITLGWAF